jgi:lipid-A-disaccharide synthase
MKPPKVMIIAIEASADALGAGLARALKAQVPGVTFIGVGGARMAAEDIESPFDTHELQVWGLIEGAMALRRVQRRVREVAQVAAREKPEVAVLIDAWGFNLRMAHALRKACPGIKLIKYVGPQLFASRPGRAKTLAKAVDHLLAILPFDAPYYEPYGLPVTFVGNPSLTLDVSKGDGARFRKAIGATKDEPVLLILPGSRPAEIRRLMPDFEDAARRLLAERRGLKVAVVAADTVANQVREAVAGWLPETAIVQGHEAKLDAMKGATVAIACSGTVTSELALAGCPMVVGYKVSKTTYAIGKHLIRTPWIVLLNIATGRAIVPELVQHACTGENLARLAAERLDDPALRARQIADQNAALEVMGRGGPDPAIKAAEVVAGYLNA